VKAEGKCFVLPGPGLLCDDDGHIGEGSQVIEIDGVRVLQLQPATLPAYLSLCRCIGDLRIGNSLAADLKLAADLEHHQADLAFLVVSMARANANRGQFP
jgi:hypothetical protein